MPLFPTQYSTLSAHALAAHVSAEYDLPGLYERYLLLCEFGLEALNMVDIILEVESYSSSSPMRCCCALSATSCIACTSKCQRPARPRRPKDTSRTVSFCQSS